MVPGACEGNGMSCDHHPIRRVLSLVLTVLVMMDSRGVFVLCFFVLIAAVACRKIKTSERLLCYHDVVTDSKDGYTVTYDDRSFMINNTRTLLLSGSVHYPRSTPGMWDGILQEMVKDGLNMVEVYIFWNLHEFKQGQTYNFKGNANWTMFVEKAAAAGLFVNLRIGPYVCAEWNYGGLPVWLNTIPGMQLRSDNEPWKKEMARFVTDIATIATPYLAKNGGPIIMAQIENEYNWDEPMYIDWCGTLAASLKLDIPWVMCNGRSANNTINTCNGNDCTTYAEDHAERFPGQPLAWTENEGWFQEWDRVPLDGGDDRTPEDMSFTILKWFARGGAHHNYYMWFGGNHFARWAGSSITNKYADGVNLHADGLANEPKKTHLQRLHMVLSKYSSPLLDNPSQINNSQPLTVFDDSTHTFINATKQFAFVYKSGSGGLIFLENWDSTTAWVKYETMVFAIPAESSSIIDYQTRTELYSSAKVDSTGLPTERNYTTLVNKLDWLVWQEDVNTLSGVFTSTHPIEQLNVTEDESDYLFYETTIKVNKTDTYSVNVQSRMANAMLAFVDGKFQSDTYNDEHSEGDVTFHLPISVSDSEAHQLTILSVNLGINNGVSPGSSDSKGITGSVTLESTDITKQEWKHRAKLQGEIDEVYTTDGSSSVTWSNDWKDYVNKSVVWFQTTFLSTSVNVTAGNSLLLDLTGMGRGHIYLNGMDLGRYWLVEVSGVPVQQYYFIPPDFIQDKNLLTLVEELGAPDPSKPALVECGLMVPPSQV